jgi:hypothetical protein
MQASNMMGAVACLYAAIGGANCFAQQDATVTMDTVVAALRKNVDRVQTLSLTWEEERFYPKNSIEHYDPNSIETAPPADAYVSSTVRLWLDGDKIALNENYQLWSWRENRFAQEPSRTVTDGKVIKHLTTRKTLHPVGGMNQPDSFQSFHTAGVRPASWPFRAVSPSYGFGMFKPDEWTVADVRADANQNRCVVLRRLKPNRNESIWLSMDHNYLPVCFASEKDGKTTFQTDLSYQQDPRLVWVPDGWTVRFYSPEGIPGRHMIAKVTECRINEPVPPRAFLIDFPIGTEVYDARIDDHYFVGPDGVKEPVVLNSDGSRQFPDK